MIPSALSLIKSSRTVLIEPETVSVNHVASADVRLLANALAAAKQAAG